MSVLCWRHAYDDLTADDLAEIDRRRADTTPVGVRA
jgi:hypothetical protein